LPWSAAAGPRRRRDLWVPTDSLGRPWTRSPKRTGGIAFYGRNNLDAGIQAAIDDAVAGYTLGFYAPQDRTQAGFHKLTVRSLRPGVTLRYKERLLRGRPENIANGDRPEAVGVALTAITDATAIPIDVQAWRQENTLTLRVSCGRIRWRFSGTVTAGRGP